MYKLTPSLYIKRALKAQSPTELLLAQIGLMALINTHMLHIGAAYMNGVLELIKTDE